MSDAQALHKASKAPDQNNQKVAKTAIFFFYLNKRDIHVPLPYIPYDFLSEPYLHGSDKERKGYANQSTIRSMAVVQLPQYCRRKSSPRDCSAGTVAAPASAAWPSKSTNA